MEVPKLDNLNKYNCTERYISVHYPEFWTYITNKYPNDLKWTEKLYWYYHNITSYSICPICGKKTSFINFNKGYCIYCSKKCLRNSQYIKDKTKQTILDRYGVEYALQNKEILEKSKQTCMIHYGVKHPLQNKKIQDKQKQTNLDRYGVKNAFQNKKIQDKQKQTNLDRYGVKNVSQTKEVRDKVKYTCLQKYNVKNVLQNRDIWQKMNNTKKHNGSFNTSKIEQSFKTWLDNNNIEYKTQYSSTDYPFNCDFYFPDKDLYLEIQGLWTHGFHPFNSNDPEDIKKLNIWKNKNTDFYNSAINTWTNSDVKKRNWAKEHNLNWIEVFTIQLDDVIKEYMSH